MRPPSPGEKPSKRTAVGIFCACMMIHPVREP
jgi:hypothetical protein